MAYRVKEIFYTLQGEGAQAGRPAVFCRFSGCNLWSGRPEDRATAKCRFCDTDFVGADAGVFATAEELAQTIAATFPVLDPQAYGGRKPYIVFTGGEPALQLTRELIDRLHALGFELGVESNGTLPLPEGLDWITVSPKGSNPLATTSGHELKLVWPQQGCSPEDFEDLDFRHFLLQPCDDPRNKANTRECIAYCLLHPRWSLGLQTHKWVGVRLRDMTFWWGREALSSERASLPHQASPTPPQKVRVGASAGFPHQEPGPPKSRVTVGSPLFL